MQAYIKFLDIFIKIIGDKDSIKKIVFVDTKNKDGYTIDSEVAKAKNQLEEYLNKQRKEFNLNLDLNKYSNFTKKVYQALKDIKYGSTASYKDIALRVNNPKACRAIGNINNKNNFVIVIPCHRIIGSNGLLIGYAPGIQYKEYLLELEKGRY